MYPIIFRIGSINFYSHGLLIALGALLGGWIIYFLAKKSRLPVKGLIELLIYSLFLGIIGARIVYIIVYYYQFGNWHELFYIWYGGLVSFGGLLGGFLSASLILKKRKQNILKWFDISIIGTLVGWAIGKLGCFLSGDTVGVASSSRIAIAGEMPVALFEAAWALILGLVLVYIYLKKKEFLARFFDGFVFFVGLAGYGFGRFWIDFFRADQLFFVHLKTGQIASLILFLLAVLSIFYLILKRKGKNNAQTNF